MAKIYVKRAPEENNNGCTGCCFRYNYKHCKYVKRKYVTTRTEEYEKAIDECLEQITIFNCFASIRVLLAEYKPDVKLNSISLFDYCNKNLDITTGSSCVSCTRYFANKHRLKIILLDL